MSDGQFTKTCMKCETEYSIIEEHKCEPKHPPEPLKDMKLVFKKQFVEFDLMQVIDGDEYYIGNVGRKDKAQRIVEVINACAGLTPEQIREAVEMRKSFAIKDVWYQLNQVRKEFKKFGKLGEHRLKMIDKALALFPKTTDDKDIQS